MPSGLKSLNAASQHWNFLELYYLDPEVSMMGPSGMG